VTQGEARAYRRYARAYESLWSGYLDPVGIRLSRQEKSWAAETFVLPLADASLYRNLSRITGAEPIVGGAGPVAPTTVMLVSLRLDPGFVRRMDDDPLALEKRLGANLRDVLLEGFGDRLTLGLLDDRLLFDFDLVEFLGGAIRWNVTRDMALAPLLAAANLPAYATVSVKDRERVRAFLDALRDGAVRDEARDAGSFALRVGAYDLIGPPGSTVETLTVSIGAFRIRLFFELRDDVLVVATRPEVVREVLDRGRPDPDPAPYALKLAVYPERWEKLKPDLMIGYEEAARQGCRRALLAREPFHSLGEAVMRRTLGWVPRCPDGGRDPRPRRARVLDPRPADAAASGGRAAGDEPGATAGGFAQEPVGDDGVRGGRVAGADGLPAVAGSARQRGDVVGVEGGIGRHDGQPLGEGLRDEEPVEGIGVVRGKARHAERVVLLHGERADPVPHQSARHEALGRLGKGQAPEPPLDGDLPGARRGEVQLVRLVQKSVPGGRGQPVRLGDGPQPDVGVEEKPQPSISRRISSGSGASKSSAIDTRLSSRPRDRRARGGGVHGTSRATGVPARAITISSPSSMRFTSRDRFVFASCMFTWATVSSPPDLASLSASSS
jgi:hypothetical protein